jgi:hypothetical protein
MLGDFMDTAVLLAVGRRIAPGIADLDAAARDRVAAIMARAIAARPRALQRQLALFVQVMRWAPVVRYGRPFERLDPPRQDAVLRWFQHAPVAALRQGFWGVKTLVFMGYYGRPEAGAAIGYRPSRSGNAILHAR